MITALRTNVIHMAMATSPSVRLWAIFLLACQCLNEVDRELEQSCLEHVFHDQNLRIAFFCIIFIVCKIRVLGKLPVKGNRVNDLSLYLPLNYLLP